MTLFPALRLGLLNGWLFLPFIYLPTQWLAKCLPKHVSPRLFDHGAWTRRDETIAFLGGFPNLVFVVLVVLTPLKITSWLLPFGAALSIVGAAACAHSIIMFVKTPADEPVTRGLYRISRNPQIVGVFIALTGPCVACGSWIALSSVAVWGVFLHARVLAEERTCLAKYGESYQEFMRRVPRYLIVSLRPYVSCPGVAQPLTSADAASATGGTRTCLPSQRS